MKKVKISISLFTALLFSFVLTAQTNVTVTFDAIVPFGDFAQSIEQLPYGGGLKIFKDNKKAPVSYGVEMTNYIYNDYEFARDLSSFGHANVLGTQENKDMFHNLNLFVRYKFNDDKNFKQYAEARFGSTTFMTVSKIWQEELEMRNININLLGTSITGGLAGGIIYKHDKMPFGIDLGVIGSYGSKARFHEYVSSEAPNVIEANPVTLTLRLGLNVELGGCACEKTEAIELTDPLGDR